MSHTPTIAVENVDKARDLRALYRAHAGDAGRLAFLLTGDRHLAEDLVHDAFIKAGARFANLRDPKSFPAYLRQTIVNLCRTHWRKESVRRAFVQRATEPEPAYQPDHGLRSEVATALGRLSSRQRTAVVLRYYEDLSEEQTAHALGCSISAAKSLLHRAKETLREELGGIDEHI